MLPLNPDATKTEISAGKNKLTIEITERDVVFYFIEGSDLSSKFGGYKGRAILEACLRTDDCKWSLARVTTVLNSLLDEKAKQEHPQKSPTMLNSSSASALVVGLKNLLHSTFAEKAVLLKPRTSKDEEKNRLWLWHYPAEPSAFEAVLLLIKPEHGTFYFWVDKEKVDVFIGGQKIPIHYTNRPSVQDATNTFAPQSFRPQFEPRRLPGKPVCVGRDATKLEIVNALVGETKETKGEGGHASYLHLSGPAGIGKSTTLLAALYAGKQAHKFGNQIIWVDAQDADSFDSLLTQINNANGFSAELEARATQRGPQPVPTQAALIASLKAIKPKTLLVLDNIEDVYKQHPDDLIRFLTRIMEKHNLSIIVVHRAKRISLGDKSDSIWKTISVPRLDNNDEGLKVFCSVTEYLPAEVQKFKSVWNEIWDIMEGNPLALRLLARAWRPGEKLDDLWLRWQQHSHKMLSPRSASEKESRSNSMDTSLSLSWKHIPEPAIGLLKLLAYLPEGVSHATLTHIIASARLSDDAKDALLEEGLPAAFQWGFVVIQEENKRLRVPKITAEFVRSHKENKPILDLDLLRPMILHYYERIIAFEGMVNDSSYADFKHDMANVNAMLKIALEASGDVVFLAAKTVRAFGNFILNLQTISPDLLPKALEVAENEAESYLSQTENVDVWSSPECVEAVYTATYLSMNVAIQKRKLSEYSSATKYLENARHYAQFLPEQFITDRKPTTRHKLTTMLDYHDALISYNQRNYSLARDKFEEVRGRTSNEDTHQQAKCLAWLAQIEFLLDEPQNALQYCEDALSIYVDSNEDPFLVTNVLRIKCDVLSFLGRLSESEKVGEQALKYNQKSGDTWGEANIYYILGTIHLMRFSLDKAREMFRESGDRFAFLGLDQYANARELYLLAVDLAEGTAGDEQKEKIYEILQRSEAACSEGKAGRHPENVLDGLFLLIIHALQNDLDLDARNYSNKLRQKLGNSLRETKNPYSFSIMRLFDGLMQIYWPRTSPAPEVPTAAACLREAERGFEDQGMKFYQGVAWYYLSFINNADRAAIKEKVNLFWAEILPPDIIEDRWNAPKPVPIWV